MLKYKRGRNLILALLTLAISLVWLTGSSVQADSIQAVAESYRTSQSLQQGMIVQLEDKDKTAVKPATYNNPKKMFGVTVAASATPVRLSSDVNEKQAYVVTSGRYRVLVSNQQGAIAAGDFVSISALDGIGMKAEDGQDTVLGRAVESFNGRDAVISTTSLNAKGGNKVDVAIGGVLVDIAIRSNPKFSGSGGVPGFVENFATTIAGKSVSAAQVYGSMLILVLGLGIVSVLVYSGIQTSMTAIGRNPLAKKSIIRNMFQVVIIAALIFIGCLIAVYLILKL